MRTLLAHASEAMGFEYRLEIHKNREESLHRQIYASGAALENPRMQLELLMLNFVDSIER